MTGIEVNRYNLHRTDTRRNQTVLKTYISVIIAHWHNDLTMLIDYLVFAQTTRWRHSPRMRTVSNVAYFVVVDVLRELDPATGASVTVD